MGLDPGTICLIFMYIDDIVPIQQQRFSLLALPLLTLVPNLSHVFKHHVKEVIKPSENARKLSFALHDDPEAFPDALVEESQRHYFD